MPSRRKPTPEPHHQNGHEAPRTEDREPPAPSPGEGTAVEEPRRVRGTPSTGVGPGSDIPRPGPIPTRERRPPRPDTLVHGVIHRSAKTIIIGGSKSFKTWSFIDLGVAIATGSTWWKHECERGKILYVNFEIHDAFFFDRFDDVCEARGVDPEVVCSDFHYLGLRGRAADMSKLAEKIRQYCEEHGYVMIIIDPIYKCLGNRDENSAGDMADLMNVLDKISAETNTAVLFGHHFSKGNQASKDMIDRGSGSGVMGRDPDTIITMTPHEDKEAFVVEFRLRNCPPQDSYVVRREHPLMVVDDEADTAALRQRNGQAGRPPTHADLDVLALLDGGPLTKAKWTKAMKEQLGMSQSSAYRRIEELCDEGEVMLQGDLYHRAPAAPNPVRDAAHRQG